MEFKIALIGPYKYCVKGSLSLFHGLNPLFIDLPARKYIRPSLESVFLKTENKVIEIQNSHKHANLKLSIFFATLNLRAQSLPASGKRKVSEIFDKDNCQFSQLVSISFSAVLGTKFLLSRHR